MKRYLRIIQGVTPEIEIEHTNLLFNEAGIDSIDLVTIRVDLEREIGQTIPDLKWMEFEKLSDIIQYCKNQESVALPGKAEPIQSKILKEITIDMPQMAIEALSENWLFKELGNLHWQMLCNGLSTKSYNLKDELNNRLYATFVRIKIQSSGALNKFRENETLRIDGDMKRYGSSMYYSSITLRSDEATIHANLMTSFSIRNDLDNTKLVKSQPDTKENLIEELDTNPQFGNEYRLIKKNELKEVKIGDVKFLIQDDSIFEIKYTINPYYDLNGVGLLYFASYPVISDVCEAGFFNTQEKNNSRWELTYHTLSRDIFYYANCNINEEILYKLHSVHYIDSNTVQISSSLHRTSDKALLARVFSIKQKPQ